MAETHTPAKISKMNGNFIIRYKGLVIPNISGRIGFAFAFQQGMLL